MNDIRDYDHRQWPFHLDGQEAFYVNCGTIEIGTEHSSDRMGFEFNTLHPRWTKIKDDVIEYFRGYRQ